MPSSKKSYGPLIRGKKRSMNAKSSLANLLRACLKRLEEAEPHFSVRSAPKRWYRREVHIPPATVALTTLVLLVAVLGIGRNPDPTLLLAQTCFASLLL